jgi:hypothetical protein
MREGSITVLLPSAAAYLDEMQRPPGYIGGGGQEQAAAVGVR